MSAKNRGGPSIPNDSYPTPKPVIRAILKKLDLIPGFSVLDPCSGAGAMLDVAREFGASETLGLELDPGLAKKSEEAGHTVLWVGDALTPNCIWPATDLILSNYPYTYAEEFFRKSLETVAPVGGTVAVLLRLGFLASDERAPFFEQYGMPDVHVVKRPSFCMTIKCKECGDRYTLPPDAERPTVCRYYVKVDQSAPRRQLTPEEIAAMFTTGSPCGSSSRPSITTTDASDYAWMVYGPHSTGVVSRIAA